jgi:hypothetical protein
MSLTLLALILIPLYLKMVLDPKRCYKLFEKIAKKDHKQFMMALWILLLALVILSETGLNFSWSWDSLLAWVGLITALKGIFYLIPGILKNKIKWVKASQLPGFGFLGLLFALALIYVDTQILL